MKQEDPRPGVRIANGHGSSVIFEIAQANLFRTPEGQLLGGTVFPLREGQPRRLVRGYDARAVAANGRITRARVTVR
jgi:hypothetical protein